MTTASEPNIFQNLQEHNMSARFKLKNRRISPRDHIYFVCFSASPQASAATDNTSHSGIAGIF
jgi:hypothetical protein